MIYQLTDGRIVEISEYLYFSCTDEEINDIMLDPSIGIMTNDPFYHSVTKSRIKEIDEELYSCLNIDDIPYEDKFPDTNIDDQELFE